MILADRANHQDMNATQTRNSSKTQPMTFAALGLRFDAKTRTYHLVRK